MIETDFAITRGGSRCSLRDRIWIIKSELWEKNECGTEWDIYC